MTNGRLEYSESNNFTTNNDFRKVGLIHNLNCLMVVFKSVVDQFQQLSFLHLGTEQLCCDELVTGQLLVQQVELLTSQVITHYV